MHAFTCLALGLVPLSFALPQAGGQQLSSEPSHQPSDAEIASSGSSDVHQYVNDAYWDWAEGGTNEYPVVFCNNTETAMIRRGLYEAEVLAAHARDHIHRWGNSSSYFKKYFGLAATTEPAGWYDKIVNGDKSGVIIRCDDPDGVCAAEPEWGGYWRGTNGSDQNNICPLSFNERWNLDSMCMHGYTVAGWTYVQFWASDLHHRLYHTVKIGEGVVDHYADDYGPSLELAMANPEEAARNTHSLAMFALDVYAYDIALPGQGCTGVYTPEEEEAVSVDSATVLATATADGAATSTESSSEECHTHADGEIHCV